jgi:hypothetical protein
MRARSRIAFVLVPAAGLFAAYGCTGQGERTYYDDLVDAAADGTVPHADANASDVETADGEAFDAGVPDAGEMADVEAGCGPLDAVANCGQCGTSCDTQHSVGAACSGGACTYSGCETGWGDCQDAGPNTDGCETPVNTLANCSGCGITCDTTHSADGGCNGTSCTTGGCTGNYFDCNTSGANADGCECLGGCCGTGCAVKHSVGNGKSFFDCNAAGAYSHALAVDACAKYTGDPSLCLDFMCTQVTGLLVCSASDQTQGCACWRYTGTDTGLVHFSTALPTGGCLCPTAAANDPSWQ